LSAGLSFTGRDRFMDRECTAVAIGRTAIPIIIAGGETMAAKRMNLVQCQDVK